MGCVMSEVSSGKAIRELHSKAARIRQTFSELFDAPPASRIVLVPSILAALHILFAKLRVRRMVLTSGEYYGALHFPAQRVESVGVKDLIKRTKELKPDVVMVSVVTWKGEVLPCAELFAEIRSMRGREGAPLLVADYCHAGAVGFPSVKKFAATWFAGARGSGLRPPCGTASSASSGLDRDRFPPAPRPLLCPSSLPPTNNPPFWCHGG